MVIAPLALIYVHVPAEDYGQLNFGGHGDTHQFVDDVGIAAFLSGCAIGSALITVLLMRFGILRRDSDQRTERFGRASLVLSFSCLVGIFFFGWVALWIRPLFGVQTRAGGVFGYGSVKRSQDKAYGLFVVVSDIIIPQVTADVSDGN
jgi:hypothetical protein